jgi:hypothetical protein
MRTVNGVFSNAAVTTLEDVVTIDVRGCEVLQFSMVVGAADLTACTIAGRVSSGGGWFTVASASGDYTTPNHPVLDASGSLVTAAAGATVHWAKLDVRGLESVRIQASSGTTSTVAGHFGTY